MERASQSYHQQTAWSQLVEAALHRRLQPLDRMHVADARKQGDDGVVLDQRRVRVVELAHVCLKQRASLRVSEINRMKAEWSGNAPGEASGSCRQTQH